MNGECGASMFAHSASELSAGAQSDLTHLRVGSGTDAAHASLEQPDGGREQRDATGGPLLLRTLAPRGDTRGQDSRILLGGDPHGCGRRVGSLHGCNRRLVHSCATCAARTDRRSACGRVSAAAAAGTVGPRRRACEHAVRGSAESGHLVESSCVPCVAEASGEDSEQRGRRAASGKRAKDSV
eukprot:scaffold168744_cov37-Tisochrysis_lutea.AAC.1